MNLERNKKLAKALMVLGLSLLFIGLSFWTYSEYQRNKSVLKEKVDLAFKSTIHEVEVNLMDNLLASVMKMDFSYNPVIDTSPTFFKQDSFTIELETDSLLVGKSHQIAVIDDQNEIGSTIKMVMKGDVFPFQQISNPKANDSIDVFLLLQEKLPNHIDHDLNMTSLNLLETAMDSSHSKNHFTTWKFDEEISNKSYFLSIENYRIYLFKKILPQLFFSILIFTIISLAFYFIYSTLKKQEILNQLRHDFMNNMTHELKTPITTIGVALEAINNFGVDNNPELRKEYIDISRLEVNRLSLLVDKVLNISTYENATIKLDKIDLELNVILDNILNTLKIKFQKFNVESNVTLEGKAFHFHGDLSHFTNVIHNLIDNALKYGNKIPILHFKIIEKENVLIFSIQDNGKGIPRIYQKQIFDKFFRIPNNDIHNVKGHGLGLSYVKKIVELHQGTIKINSQENLGSTFIIEIPKNG